MSLLLTGGVAVAYAASVVGVHRVAVHRRRRQAGFYPTLRWLDWDTLLEGVAPASAGPTNVHPAQAPEGGPWPRVLASAPRPESQRRHATLCAVVEGRVGSLRFEDLGFESGDASWLAALVRFRTAPQLLLEQLATAAARTPAEAYLREVLVMERESNLLTLELSAFGVKRRLRRALAHFGDHPALFFARAKASSLLGFNGAVLDDLARAVYYSREHPFYLRAVAECPWIEEARPSLAKACRLAISRLPEVG